jgi:hypothetical protein
LLFADARDCYGTIGPEVVDEALRRLGCDAAAAGAIRRFLVRLAALGVRGLPVGPDPSAVLANAVLAGVDGALRRAGVEHLRWVDDVVAGVADPAAARPTLELVRRHLALAGLELNETKTRVVSDPSAHLGGWGPSMAGARPAVG